MGVEQLFSEGEQGHDEVNTYDFLCVGDSNSDDSPSGKFSVLKKENSIGMSNFHAYHPALSSILVCCTEVFTSNVLISEYRFDGKAIQSLKEGGGLIPMTSPLVSKLSTPPILRKKNRKKQKVGSVLLLCKTQWSWSEDNFFHQSHH